MRRCALIGLLGFLTLYIPDTELGWHIHTRDLFDGNPLIGIQFPLGGPLEIYEVRSFVNFPFSKMDGEPEKYDFVLTPLDDEEVTFCVKTEKNGNGKEKN